MSNEISINQARVRGVVHLATHIVAQEIRDLHPVEALLGFAEATGRVIAAQEGTEVMHKEMIKIATDHIVDTVRASYSSQGKNSVTIN